MQSFLSVVEFPCFPCVCRFIAGISSRILQIGDSVMALVLLQCCCATESIFLCSLYFHFHLSMALNFFGTLLFCVKFLFCKFCSLTVFLCFAFHLCILWSHASSVRYLPFQTILFFWLNVPLRVSYQICLTLLEYLYFDWNSFILPVCKHAIFLYLDTTTVTLIDVGNVNGTWINKSFMQRDNFSIEIMILCRKLNSEYLAQSD